MDKNTNVSLNLVHEVLTLVVDKVEALERLYFDLDQRLRALDSDVDTIYDTMLTPADLYDEVPENDPPTMSEPSAYDNFESSWT